MKNGLNIVFHVLQVMEYQNVIEMQVTLTIFLCELIRWQVNLTLYLFELIGWQSFFFFNFETPFLFEFIGEEFFFFNFRSRKWWRYKQVWSNFSLSSSGAIFSSSSILLAEFSLESKQFLLWLLILGIQLIFWYTSFYQRDNKLYVTLDMSGLVLYKHM